MSYRQVFRERRKSRARALEGRYRMLRKMYVAEFLEALFAAVIVAVILRVFFISVYRIPSDSMAPTLVPGDLIVAIKSSYGVQVPGFDWKIGSREPGRGDVVVFHLPDDETLFVKRVVGIAGDRIEIRDEKLFVNGVATEIPNETPNETPKSTGDTWETGREVAGATTHWVMRRTSERDEEADFLAPLVVPPGQLFLMGDLRSESSDSRQWGPLPASLVVARASFIATSFPIRGTASVLPEAVTGSRLARMFKAIE